MTVTYGFYNSLAGDRVYNAIQMSQLFSSIIADGVLGAVGNAFHVSAGTGMHVTVGTGRAWFKNSWTDNDTLLTLDIAAAHAVLPRIDVVCIEMDSDNGVRANSIKVITGTPSSTPVAPTLTHTTTLNQYPFAHVLVPAAATQILASNITNKIGTTDCPLVTGILQTMTIDNIVAQWEAQFAFWFTTLQDQLDENQAANLQGQITNSNNTLIEEIISTGAADEFVFDAIPGGFSMLHLVGMLKSTYVGGYDGSQPMLRVNDDAGANYAWMNTDTGTWTGWGTRTSANVSWVVGSNAADAGIYTRFQVDFPNYASPSMQKWIKYFGIYAAAGSHNQNPTLDPYDRIINNLWRSNSPITKITLYGTYVATLSKLKLFGSAF